MAFEINITGEIVPFNYWDEKGYINLSDVESQLSKAEGKDIKVNINSIGGDVEEGFMIYTALRKYAKENNAKITTYAKGRCFSIATVVFLSGDERIANKFVEPFVHNAWTYVMDGDAKLLNRVAADLEAVNEKIGKFYAEHTNLTYEEARQLMDNDSYISPEESVKIRFATSIEEVMRPAALHKILNKKSKINNMAKKDEKGLFAILNKFFSETKPLNKVLFTSTAEEIVFPDLGDDDVAKVGDKATIDGSPADGEVKLSDGTVYVFEAGVLTEIREPEEEEEENAELEELRTENAKLKEDLAALNTKVEGVLAKQKQVETNWKNLKNKISEYTVETKDNGGKGNGEGEEGKGRLGKAIANLKK